MSNALSIWVMAVAGIVTSPHFMSAQEPRVNASDALVDVMVFGAYVEIDSRVYSPSVRAALERHLQRSKAYRPRRATEADAGDMRMVYESNVEHERELAAVSDDPRAPALAKAYVASLKPCYEWEGYHDCPEREAVFASQYLIDHPVGPFSKFLPLLVAHRWLCAAEAFDYEKQPDGAARSRRAYELSIATARRSTDLLVRTAAVGLMARGLCYSRR